MLKPCFSTADGVNDQPQVFERNQRMYGLIESFEGGFFLGKERPGLSGSGVHQLWFRRSHLNGEHRTPMISLKKYLDSEEPDPRKEFRQDPREVLPAAIKAYRSALVEMGSCSTDACPALGNDLKRELGRLEIGLATAMNCELVESTQKSVQDQLQEWGRRTAAHYRQTTKEVKDLLLVMARAAEAVGERDLRCAGQLNNVTNRLEESRALRTWRRFAPPLSRAPRS